ncbi:hypothetical protein V8G54_005664 [Vigna mungo]|uniref:Uncharacterized protein n=1 Tax=Vigna mungo TaxID=3915 RepID=A0AAQ3P0H5_VIGMU
MMNSDEFTNKTNEALKSAHKIAVSSGHAQYTPCHLAYSPLSDKGESSSKRYPTRRKRNRRARRRDHQQSVVAKEDVWQHAPGRRPAHPQPSERFSNLRLARCGNTEGEIRSRRQGRKESGKRHRRWLERKVGAEFAKMLLKEEIVENSIVYIDVGLAGSELIYRVEKNGGSDYRSSYCSGHRFGCRSGWYVGMFDDHNFHSRGCYFGGRLTLSAKQTAHDDLASPLRPQSPRHGSAASLVVLASASV